MAYNTPESVADYLSRFQMQVTERTKGTFSPMHVKYSLALKMGSSSFETTFQSNPNVHGEPTVTLIYPGERYGLDGCLTYELNAYSGAPAAAHRASYPLVEFYDTSQDAARFPGGQFVSRYYMTDLLEDNSIAVSIDTMLKNGNQFSLDGGIPAWTVEGDDLAKVNDFLKKSCMEFCGSLPGDEMGEDGYSLTGEARDAATSRNGLNENRKSVAEMIQECFDSIENNGDAI